MTKLKQVKIVAAIFAMTLTAYPVIELSRCIIEYDIITSYHGGIYRSRVADFYAELGLIWLFYLLLPVAVSYLVGLAYRMGAGSRKEQVK
jgi:hypothetical protein